MQDIKIDLYSFSVQAFYYFTGSQKFNDTHPDGHFPHVPDTSDIVKRIPLGK